MNKHIYKITAAAVLGFAVSIFAATLFMKDPDSSTKENRTLTKMPKLSASSLYDGSYFSQLGNCLTDHFAFRTRFLEFSAGFNSRFGEGIVNNVYITSDRLLDADVSNRIVSPLASEKINSFVNSYNGTVYIAAIPTSTGVYGDILPSYLMSMPESQQISDFYDSLGSGIRKIDAYNILKMLKDNYIYYRNDTKWTSYGAYCIYRTVIQKLGFIPTSYDKYTIRHVTDSFRGNLYNRTLYAETRADFLDIYEYPNGAQIVSCMSADKNGTDHETAFYDMDKLETGDMYSMYLGDPCPVLEIETNVNNQRSLLVIKDSYADCFIPFLTQHFTNITVVSPEYLEGQIGDYINISDYEQTLILFGIENIDNPKLFSNICQ